MMLAEIQVVLADDDQDGREFCRQFEKAAEVEGWALLSTTIRSASSEEQDDAEAQNIGR